MTGRLRRGLRSSPRFVALYRGIRGFVRGGAPASGRTPPPTPRVEERVGQLRRVSPIPSARSEFRLNLVVPTLDAARTFGGIRTALDVFEATGADVGQRRIVSVGRTGSGAGDAVAGYQRVEGSEDPVAPLQYVALERPWAPLAVRDGDVFVATFWTTAELIGRIRGWQTATYGWVPPHFAYVVQDYEPGFYPWSAQWLLARATYARPDETIGIYNTSSLRDYFHESGVRFGQEYAFEPRMLPELRAALTSPAVQRSRTIVVYGRPGTPRNAFPAIVDGLRAWRADDPNAARWTVLSVGQAHPEIDLGGGLMLRSIGKLDLAAYATLLRESAIGISLMVSPHPSYPPLEMAHLGMLVLTNRFGAKDLSTWHSNIRTMDDLSAEGIAARLTESCRQFEADPDIGDAGRSGRPEFTSDAPQFPFAAQLAAELRAGVERDRPARAPESASSP